MLNFTLLQLAARGDFSPIFTVGTWYSSWRYSSQSVVHLSPPPPTKNLRQAACSSASQSCPCWASSILSVQFRFSYSGTSSHGGFYLCIYAPVNCDSLYQLVCLTWGKRFSPRPQFSDGSEESCWFCFFSVLSSGRSDGFRSSLHAGPQTESLPSLSMLFTSFVQNSFYFGKKRTQCVILTISKCKL